VYGVFWFLGSWILGILYDTNRLYLILVSLFSQLIAFALLFRFKRTAG